jgi:hypothetical protein
LCFDILALFPDCAEASDLVYELFCDEWTIYDNRVTIQQNIDEWDDRPHHRRTQVHAQHLVAFDAHSIGLFHNDLIVRC